MFWKYEAATGESNCQKAFDTALKSGINFLDTAEVYGYPGSVSERLIGRFMKDTKERPVVATKFAMFPWRLTEWQFSSCLQGSLNRLGVDSIDLYQIHWSLPWWVPGRSLDVWTKCLGDAVESGKVKAVGISRYSEAEMRRVHALLKARNIPLASHQFEYSLLHRQPERDGTMQACKELGVTVLAFSPLAMGRLTGKFTVANPPPSRRHFGNVDMHLVEPVIELLRTIGAAHGDKTPAQVALNWCICKGAVPLAGARTASQAAENAGALGWRLTSEEVQQLDDITKDLS
eukprot:GILK01012939.1.p1 GENE.GILK01012939.1~~GILK01012939.1.p1  ORF type:complete len:289 (-),score=26.08 GILK01012939.1:126-992(-)